MKKTLIKLLGTTLLLASCQSNVSLKNSVTISLKGKPVQLVGVRQAPEIGDKAPDFRALDVSFRELSLSSLRGHLVLISSVPSLDTGICAAQTQRFTEALADLDSNVKLLTISMDLPFAQKRFCTAHKINEGLILSDFRDRSFGVNYGMLMKQKGLLGRGLFLIGRDGKILWRQIVPEVASHPDYNGALVAIKKQL